MTMTSSDAPDWYEPPVKGRRVIPASGLRRWMLVRAIIFCNRRSAQQISIDKWSHFGRAMDQWAGMLNDEINRSMGWDRRGNP